MFRFPIDFMFELTKDEYNSLRSQIVTLKNKGRGQHSKYMPHYTKFLDFVHFFVGYERNIRRA